MGLRRPLLIVLAAMFLGGFAATLSPGLARPRSHTRAHHVATPTPALDAAVSALDAAVIATPVTPTPAPVTTPACPDGMVRVTGSWCPEVRQRCDEWAPDRAERCLHFREPSRCESRDRRAMDFCMDRYEWPNREGERPVVMVSWYEARAMCQQAGKRLCSEDEWTFSCEGEAMLPYPYGYDRDAAACVIDREFRHPDRRVLHYGTRAQALAEAALSYAAQPSGSSARCASPFGVRDLTGNVDEWTQSHGHRRFESALKGGYWGHVRTRCRPTTTSHNESFRFYQIGFRCCSDAPSPPAPSGTSVAAPVVMPRRHRRHHHEHHHREHHHRHRPHAARSQ